MNRCKLLKGTIGIVVIGSLSYIVAPIFARQSTTRNLVSSEEYAVLDEMFRTHMNYFLSPQVITAFGFPLTAYKVGNRARFGYSNPTEWGYTWQAWIAAAERGIISKTQAANRLKNALKTLESIQQNPNENYNGLFYPFYKMTNPTGEDLSAPYRDPDPNIPSGDNALLYASLLIIEGWGRKIEDTDLWKQAKSIRERMNFRMFLHQNGTLLYLAHTINADSGQLSQYNWNIFADEGGVVTWIAYLSDSISFEEYKMLTENQIRRAASWTSCTKQTYTVKEAAWFNAMFPWSVRSLAGLPIGDFDAPEDTYSLYSKESFVPAVQAHLAYGDCVGVDYPAFSDAMSQAENGKGLVGWVQNWFIPPNLAGTVGTTPKHAVPHAFFVPFNAVHDLPTTTRTRLIAEIVELKEDKAGYYHSSGPYPFGFEVIVSSYKDDVNYKGADDGRNVFEALSAAYTVLSLFNALQLIDNKPTFYSFAAEVPGYKNLLTSTIGILVYEKLTIEAERHVTEKGVSLTLNCLGKITKKPISGTWSITGNIGSVTPTYSISTVFNATKIGIGTITVSDGFSTASICIIVGKKITPTSTHSIATKWGTSTVTFINPPEEVYLLLSTTTKTVKLLGVMGVDGGIDIKVYGTQAQLVRDTIGTVSIAIDYNPATLGNIDPTTLKLYVSHDYGETWKKVEEQHHDQQNNRIYGTLTYLSLITIGGKTPGTITKIATPQEILPGGTVTYTINYYVDKETCLVIRDFLPDELIFATSTPPYSTFTENYYEWNLGTLTPDTWETITIEAKVDTNIPPCTYIENKVVLLECGEVSLATATCYIHVGTPTPPELFERDLTKLIVYPNPCILSKGYRHVYFDKLPKDATIKIYDISGALVKEIKVDEPKEKWNIQAEGIASGVYIYIVKYGKEFKTGKLAIIR